MQRGGISTVFQQFSGTQVSVENDRAAVILILLMSIAPSLFSSDETHCCASKRQKNICCTRGLFLLLDYQVYTCQHCSGISNAPTQEQLQDTAEKVK